MKRREFLGKGLLAAMALPFVVTQKARGWVVAILAIIVITVIATVFFQLWKLCKKFLGDPPPPPPDKKPDQSSPALNTGGASGISIPFKPPVECFSMILEYIDDFLTPDGVTYYTGIFQASVYDSTDMVTWNLTGTVTAWLSEGFIKIQNCDQYGDVLSVVTTPDWNTEGVSLALFSPQMPPASQRFFKMEPVS